eukprot:5596037-Prymnesium_polylepis.1
MQRPSPCGAVGAHTLCPTVPPSPPPSVCSFCRRQTPIPERLRACESLVELTRVAGCEVTPTSTTPAKSCPFVV